MPGNLRGNTHLKENMINFLFDHQLLLSVSLTSLKREEGAPGSFFDLSGSSLVVAQTGLPCHCWSRCKLTGLL